MKNINFPFLLSKRIYRHIDSVFFVILIVSVLLLPVAAIAQSAKISVNFKNEKLEHVINQLEAKSGYHFLYNSTLIDPNKRITVVKKNAEINEVLKEMLNGTGIKYKIDEKHVILYLRNETEIPGYGKQKSSDVKVVQSDAASISQTFITNQDKQSNAFTVQGIVKNDQGIPLAGASICYKNDKHVLAITDANGRFELQNITNPHAILVFTYMGYAPQEVKIGKNTDLNIVMMPNIRELSDVVVTGYQTLSRERSAGSFVVIPQEALKNKLQHNILARIEGLAAGYTSYKGDIHIRGTSSIIGSSSPLFVVDGVPFEGSLSSINPSEVVNVTILKDATAASIYGARSANGVVVITTRGGLVNKTVVEYSGSAFFQPLVDNRKSLHLMTSPELIRFQEEMFAIKHDTRDFTEGSMDMRKYMNPISAALYDLERGTITQAEYNKIRDLYASRDNYNQLVDNFLNKLAITQQHNLSLRGGTDKYNYALSANYSNNRPFEKGQNNNRQIGYNLKGTYNFYKWLKADLGVLGSSNYSNTNNGFSANSNRNGGTASYNMIFDEEGNQLPWYPQGKSQYEIDRLKRLGLLDESYYPVYQMNQWSYKSYSNYTNINMNLRATIIKGLTAEVRFQTENASSYSDETKTKDNASLRSMINDATAVTYLGGLPVITPNVPTGGYILTNRADRNSYTMRFQMNFNRTFGNNNITALAGAERRKTASSSNGMEKYGHDEFGLAYKYIDEFRLINRIIGTESLNGTYTHGMRASPFGFSDNRYVAFYGNASYTYKNRYGLTGSVRMDQSNLFGTDPRYQYRPLWSIGANWQMSKESFMQDVKWLSFLSLRVTYGINGNIPKVGGPYLVTSTTDPNYINQYATIVTSPPNSGLRWEKTHQFNAAVDFRFFDRFGGSIEFYRKNTNDLLSIKENDPTTGWGYVYDNYAAMYNQGIELALNSTNITSRDFEWTTILNCSYNKNMVTDLYAIENSIVSHVRKQNTRAGLPLGAMYDFKWAGYDRYGHPLAYKKDGTIVSSTDNIEVADLVYSGTVSPPYSAALTNNIRYKALNLSFMMIYYGGNVLRDAMTSFINSPEIFNASGVQLTQPPREFLNYWKSPEDGNDPSKSPAVYPGAPTNVQFLWYRADKHVIKGDYIKLREITLAYTLPRGLLKKLYVSDLTIQGQLRNVWTWTANKRGIDPEGRGGDVASDNLERTPKMPIVYSVGLNVKF